MQAIIVIVVVSGIRVLLIVCSVNIEIKREENSKQNQ